MGQGIMKTIIAETMHFRVGLQLVKDLFVRSVVFIQMVTQAIVFILTGAMFELQMMEQGQFYFIVNILHSIHCHC